MRYLAIPQPTAAWLLAHSNVLAALHLALASEDLSTFRTAEFAAGPLRVAGSGDGRVLAVWNREYLSGTGEESWALMRLEEPLGLLSDPEISQQVLERMIYVANERLQGLVLDGELIHRQWPNGTHTCLAGRGTEARKVSICYHEVTAGVAGVGGKTIVLTGPGYDFDRLTEAGFVQSGIVGSLSSTANDIIDGSRRRPVIDSPAFSELRSALNPPQDGPRGFGDINVSVTYGPAAGGASPYETSHWTFDQWLSSGTLNDAQQRVIGSDALRRHPVRVIGPAGSGKTLVMQLAAMKYLRHARDANEPLKVLYVVHNAAMQQTVYDRLVALGAEEFLTSPTQSLSVSTLSEYGRRQLGIDESTVIDKDAQKTKLFQLEQIREALSEALSNNPQIVAKSDLLRQLQEDEDLFGVFAVLVMAEISIAIKGRGLVDDPQRYIGSEVPFSRFHRILKTPERRLVYDCFQRYHKVVFEQFEMLDSDDLALSLAGRLRTPVWQLRRKAEGFDFIFVDEAQLFNENERRVFPYLAKGQTAHVPIALALDEAQEPFGFSSAGLATLGISDVESESLPSNHRSTREIVELAFHVIQRTTDLFNSDFPEFAVDPNGMVASDHPLAAPPVMLRCNEDSPSYGRFLVRLVQRLRSKNIRQIAVICHAESYWDELCEKFSESQLPLHLITQRGEKISPDQPLVVLSRPSHVGGQEFDAVVLVGVEHGLVPPKVVDNPTLSMALEQQALREAYLAISRARYRVVIALNVEAQPSAIMLESLERGLVLEGMQI